MAISTLMTPALSALYDSQRIQIAPDAFNAINAKADSVMADLERLAQVVKNAGQRYEALQGSGKPVKFFDLSGPKKQVYPLPQGTIYVEFNFEAGERIANSSQSRISLEGLHVSFNSHSSGFFDVLSFLAAEAGGKCQEGDWLRVSPTLKDAHSYDVKPDAIATIELWLGTNYPPLATALFREECVKAGLIATDSAPAQKNVIQ